MTPRFDHEFYQLQTMASLRLSAPCNSFLQTDFVPLWHLTDIVRTGPFHYSDGSSVKSPGKHKHISTSTGFPLKPTGENKKNANGRHPKRHQAVPSKAEDAAASDGKGATGPCDDASGRIGLSVRPTTHVKGLANLARENAERRSFSKPREVPSLQAF